jgi:hypothetical protein
MTQIVGIRDGHRVTTTVTGPAGSVTIDRQHHPDCPCRTTNPGPAQRSTMETARIDDLPAAEQATTEPAVWPVFTLQRWDWEARSWELHGEYESERGEGNAYFAVSSERASSTGPIRLLKDGAVVLADDPATYYDA